MKKLDKFTLAYIEAALWSSNDESDETGGNPLDQNYSLEDFAPEALDKIIKDCKDFQEQNAVLISQAEYKIIEWDRDELAGHDFWLTRNGHGTGFWDRGLGKIGEQLTKNAKAYGECCLYLGDDGKIYML